MMRFCTQTPAFYTPKHPFCTMKLNKCTLKKAIAIAKTTHHKIKQHKVLTRVKKGVNLPSCFEKNTPRDDNPKDLLAKGASAPSGIALFLCQKYHLYDGRILGDRKICRNLLPGLSTRFTPIAQSMTTFRVGLKPQAKGHDYAQHIQHASSPCATTPQNPNPFNSISLYSLKGCLPFAFCTFNHTGGVA